MITLSLIKSSEKYLPIEVLEGIWLQFSDDGQRVDWMLAFSNTKGEDEPDFHDLGGVWDVSSGAFIIDKENCVRIHSFVEDDKLRVAIVEENPSLRGKDAHHFPGPLYWYQKHSLKEMKQVGSAEWEMRQVGNRETKFSWPLTKKGEWGWGMKMNGDERGTHPSISPDGKHKAWRRRDGCLDVAHLNDSSPAWRRKNVAGVAGWVDNAIVYCEGHRQIVFTRADGKEISRLSLPDEIQTDHDRWGWPQAPCRPFLREGVVALSISPDARFLATLDSSCRIALWDLKPFLSTSLSMSFKKKNDLTEGEPVSKMPIPKTRFVESSRVIEYIKSKGINPSPSIFEPDGIDRFFERLLDEAVRRCRGNRRRSIEKCDL